MSKIQIGDFGETITAVLLEKKYQEHNLQVVRVGSEHLPYDLIILDPPKADTPFQRPVAISVKSRGAWSNVIPPSEESIRDSTEKLTLIGFEFWISFVHYQFEEDRLHFEVYLVRASDLDSTGDFKRINRAKGYENQILTDKLKQKAIIKFLSK